MLWGPQYSLQRVLTDRLQISLSFALLEIVIEDDNGRIFGDQTLRDEESFVRIVNRYVRILLLVLLACGGFLIISEFANRNESVVVAQAGGGQANNFVGAWCAQGDPTKHASISDNGAFLNLTNENGDTSIGNYQGSNQVSAPGWQFVTGTLSGDGSRINWSNGTFWARCSNGNGYRKPNLNGIWYPNGNRSLSCSIQQHRDSINFQNETGQRATGSFDGKRHLSTNWSGTKIGGTISADGNRIDWDNGTYWVRYRVYSQSN